MTDAGGPARTDLLAQLSDQLELLRGYCVEFDKGAEVYAKPMATALRVLLYDTKVSHSLLGQLGMLDSTSWLNTAAPIHHGNLATSWGLIYAQFTAMDDVGTLRGSWQPRFDDPLQVVNERRIGAPILIRSAAPKSIEFKKWWEMPIIFDGHGTFSRRDIVWFVANKDGGSHVDRALPQNYERLSRLNSLGVGVLMNNGVEVPLPDPVAPTLRQITHETLVSLERRRAAE